VAERVRVASVEGRIDSEELEQRLAATYGARTVAELDRIVADISPPPPPPQAPAYAPPPASQGIYSPIPYTPPTNGMAVASLVSGLTWMGWFGSFLAVIFGHVALSQIKKSGGHEGGTGLAIAGLVFGYLGIAFLALIVIIAVAS
jgi:hypothetical protein